MRSLKTGWLIVAAALLATACANQKEPAEKAVAQVESALAAVKDEAAKYAPEALQGVESTLAGTIAFAKSLRALRSGSHAAAR